MEKSYVLFVLAFILLLSCNKNLSSNSVQKKDSGLISNGCLYPIYNDTIVQNQITLIFQSQHSFKDVIVPDLQVIESGEYLIKLSSNSNGKVNYVEILEGNNSLESNTKSLLTSLAKIEFYENENPRQQFCRKLIIRK